MISNFHILLIGSLLCFLMMLVMLSLVQSRMSGVREWILANALGAVAFVMFAYGKVLPPFLSFEVTDTVYAAASAFLFAGFRRFFGRPLHAWWLGGSVLAVGAGIALFHYVLDSFAARTAVIALHQGLLALFIGLTVSSSRRQRSRYPYLFTKTIAAVVLVGHAVRCVIYFMQANEMTALLQPSPWNLLFLSLGTLVLPALSFGAVMMVHDNMLAKLEDMANHDFLTGAWTRRAFFELADREIARSRRSGRRMALLLIDIDHFKNINDSLGHAEGDQVLVDLVLRAETVIRDGVDHFARIGGEEFALLLPETEGQGALVVAERLRSLLHASESKGPAYSVSIGIAVSAREEALREMMHRADQALYQAKQGGRNRVVLQSA